MSDRIGIGAQAEVFLSGDCAIKLFKPEYNKAAIFYEAAIMSLIEQTSLPIAKIREVLNIDNRMAIKMDYIPGKSLNDYMMEGHISLLHYLEQMVNIQLNIFSKSLKLPFSLKRMLQDKIESNNDITELVQKKLQIRLSSLPEGQQLCHGDFHGQNIIIRNDEPFIIDWVDATSGCPDGDACRTYMLYSFYRPDIAEKYLDCYCNAGKKNKGDVLEWLPVIAAARLHDNNGNEKEKIHDWINNML
jgi:tRNA A-37 threonylcarbamoyl transferase component Bud32